MTYSLIDIFNYFSKAIEFLKLDLWVKIYARFSEGLSSILIPTSFNP